MRFSIKHLASRLVPTLILVVASSHALEAESGARPNLLVVTFDTTRADRLGPYGYSNIETKALDRLASEGTTFLEVHAQSPQTLPNHASLFTGLYTITHNVRSNGQRLEDNAITLAEVLRTEGYQTGAIVATAALLSDFNLDQGFRSYNDDFEDAALSRAVKSFFRFFSRSKINMTSTRPANRVSTLARRWLTRAAAKKKPFFLWVHFFDPHAPYRYRPDFRHPNRFTHEDSSVELRYLREIEFADYHLGKVLNHLDSLGVASNTLVVMTADHGESLGEHDYLGHRQEVYEQIARIPLIMRLPSRVQAGHRSPTPAMTIDVAPTILSLLSIPYPDDAFVGKDLFALGSDTDRKRFSLAVKLFTKSPIRTALYYRQYKFIQFDNPQRNALFDLANDPDESLNLLGSSSVPLKLDWVKEVEKWYALYERLTVTDFQMTDEQMERLRSLGYVEVGGN